MKRTHVLSLTCIAATLLLVPAAYGQATRTFVSGVGNDVNPCSRTAPCRTFAGAIVKTFINGEINALDAGGFGTVNITKSITINGSESYSSILASGTTGIIVNIPVGVNDPKRRVHLRNIYINGTGATGAVGTATGIRGIRFDNGNQLIVENCLIQGFNQFGIDLNFNNTATLNAQVEISNTTITDITNSAVRSRGALMRTGLSRVLIFKTGFGFDVTGSAGIIEDSTISSVTNQAIIAQGGGVINVDGGSVFNSGTGVATVGAGSTVRIANLAIYNNTTGISIGAGGTVASFGGNKNAGNVTAGSPNLNIPLQ